MYFDVAAILIVLLFGIKGAKNHFIPACISLFNCIVSVVFGKQMTLYLLNELPQDKIPPDIIYFIVIILFYMLLSIWLFIFKAFFEEHLKKKYDLLFGFLIGVIKGILITSFMLLFINTFEDSLNLVKNYGQRSKINNIFFDNSDKIDKFISKEVRAKIHFSKNKEKIAVYIENLLK